MTEANREDARKPPTPPPCSAAHLFAVLWDALSDIMGSAATATLLRRAAKHATSRTVDLAELAITRSQFSYDYALPASWLHDCARTHASLQELVWSLSPLLRELTGPVVHHRLSGIPEFKACGLLLEVTP